MGLREIYRARGRLRGRLRVTPIERSHFLEELCGADVYLKLENQQVTGSFKVRGAMNKMLTLPREERERGVVAASSGNHAQGVGYVAKELGVEATVIVPKNTPKVKIEAIRRYGVKLVVHGDEYIEAERYARAIERDEGKIFISPYNDPEVIAGQGTIGLEMLEEIPELDVIIVPVGGGGLISGIACAVKGFSERVEVVGVQSVASPVMYESIRRGRIVEMELKESIAEGLHGGIEEGSITFDICRRLVDEFILVEEGSIREAIRILACQQRQVAEGAGAAGVAAILENRDRFRGRKVGVVVSGGNIEGELLQEILADLPGGEATYIPPRKVYKQRDEERFH
ncbi:MAG: threonine/serine dehydratase [Candidatus Bathyarchaeia archaeon]